ncbi:hypothetical protein LNTAR_13052 [Lentisphaera araneosa HTCC2155]|uniref:Uncharacterized protein n=1 Tax=Lentisphaera araneosa HTCC2155 TaxID=313628 RepID=A6DRK9_9BACT|nr:hypothetical protein LNTAR_13052 [Lentisphaera araneosa HTCC2155]
MSSIIILTILSGLRYQSIYKGIDDNKIKNFFLKHAVIHITALPFALYIFFEFINLEIVSSYVIYGIPLLVLGIQDYWLMKTKKKMISQINET